MGSTSFLPILLKPSIQDCPQDEPHLSFQCESLILSFFISSSPQRHRCVHYLLSKPSVFPVLCLRITFPPKSPLTYYFASTKCPSFKIQVNHKASLNPLGQELTLSFFFFFSVKGQTANSLDFLSHTYGNCGHHSTLL